MNGSITYHKASNRYMGQYTKPNGKRGTIYGKTRAEAKEKLKELQREKSAKYAAMEEDSAQKEINQMRSENEKEISASSILREIANIQKDNSHIFDALKQLESVKSEGPGDIGAEEKAKAEAAALNPDDYVDFSAVTSAVNAVIYGKYSGTEVSVDGKDYLIMKQSDILAIL